MPTDRLFFARSSVNSENEFLRSCRDLDFEWNCRNYAVAVMCKPGPRHNSSVWLAFPSPHHIPGNWAAIDGGSPDADAANQSRTSSQSKNALSVNAML